MTKRPKPNRHVMLNLFQQLIYFFCFHQTHLSSPFIGPGFQMGFQQVGIKEIINKIFEDPFLSSLSSLAKEKNIPIFLVGGYIRDFFLGLHRKDYDFALPKEASSFIPMIEEILHLHFFKIGKEEMNTTTYRMIRKDMSIDLTLFQGETIEEDLQRRDFTINAIAFSLRDETFHSVEGSHGGYQEQDDSDRVKTIDRSGPFAHASGHPISSAPSKASSSTRGLEEEISLKKEEIKKITWRADQDGDWIRSFSPLGRRSG